MTFKKENWDFSILYFRQFSVVILFLLLTVLANFFELATPHDDIRAYSIGYGFITFRFFSGLATYIKDQFVTTNRLFNFFLEFPLDIFLLITYLIFLQTTFSEDYTKGVITL